NVTDDHILEHERLGVLFESEELPTHKTFYAAAGVIDSVENNHPSVVRSDLCSAGAVAGPDDAVPGAARQRERHSLVGNDGDVALVNVPLLLHVGSGLREADGIAFLCGRPG